MVHAILLASQFRAVMRQGKRVCRHVDLRDNLHAQAIAQLLQGDELLLRIIAIARREAGERLALQAESRVGLIPIMLEILLEAVIIQVDLERIHLIIGHHLNVIAQITHRDVLTSAIHHKATDAIIRIITG